MIDLNMDILLSEMFGELDEAVEELGGLGPVAEGLFLWLFVLGGIVAITVWLGAKSN